MVLIYEACVVFMKTDEGMNFGMKRTSSPEQTYFTFFVDYIKHDDIRSVLSTQSLNSALPKQIKTFF